MRAGIHMQRLLAGDCLRKTYAVATDVKQRTATGVLPVAHVTGFTALGHAPGINMQDAADQEKVIKFATETVRALFICCDVASSGLTD